MPDQLDPSVATLAHYNARAEAFREGTWDHDVAQNIDALLAHMPSKGAWILDFGCGPGRDLITFTRRGHIAVGLDGAVEFVRMAREASTCEVWHQNFLSLELPPSHFDGIFANASLQHVPNEYIDATLRSLAAALKPGGVLFASIPHANDTEGWNNGRFSSYRSPALWLAMLSRAGFTELNHYYRPSGLPREQQPWLAGVWRRGS